MAPAGHAPEWPDKAMFAAILLVIAGALGTIFRLALPAITVQQDNLPSIFTDEIPGYELTLCLITLVFGVLSLWRQAAVFAYLGAVTAILSLAVYGLVPFFGVLAIAAIIKSHIEGEETRNDGVQLHSSQWPDKAMAASLFILVVGSIAILQGILLLIGKFDPIVLNGMPVVAGIIGIVVGLLGFWAARDVYNLQRPWMGWFALGAGLLTMGFYLIGPLMAIIGMILLGLAHKEDEFLIHTADYRAEQERKATAAKPVNAVKKGRRRKPTAA